MMRNRINQNLKGTLGEKVVKRELSDFLLFTVFDIIDDIEVPDRNSKEGKGLDYFYWKNGAYYKNGCLYKNHKWCAYYCKKIRGKFGSLTLPDFWVKDTKIFIEVKTGEYAKLEKSQQKEFPKILQKGYRIFIIRPKLLIEKRKIKVVGFSCSEFLGKNKGRKISLTQIKQLIKKERLVDEKGTEKHHDSDEGRDTG